MLVRADRAGWSSSCAFSLTAPRAQSTLFPFSTTIAEDFAGFPTLCLPTAIGGVGFEYRLALGNPHLCALSHAV